MAFKDNMQTLHIIVKGKVQGVFFRASAKDEALRLRISGWVRNTSEGNVEISVTGDREALNKFLNWCKHGPAKARVTEIICNKTAFQSFADFKIKP